MRTACSNCSTLICSIFGAESAEFHYNFGLLYIDLENYTEAREQAELAYAKGAPFPGLKNKLTRLGEW